MQEENAFLLNEIKNIMIQQTENLINDSSPISIQDLQYNIQLRSEKLVLSEVFSQDNMHGFRVYDDIIQISTDQVLITIGLFHHDHQFIVIQLVVEQKKVVQLQCKNISLLVEQKRQPVYQILGIRLDDRVGTLIASHGQIVRVINQEQRYLQATSVLNCFIIQSKIMKMSRVENSFGVDGLDLIIVGYEDHQIDIINYSQLMVIIVLKEAFSCPSHMIYLREIKFNQQIFTCSRDGSICVWQLTEKNLQAMKISKHHQNSHLFPKFNAIPLMRLTHIVKNQVVQVDLFGQLIFMLEADHKFSVWYIEQQFRLCTTLWQFYMSGPVYTSMTVDESTSKMFLSTNHHFQIVSIPDNADGVFEAQQYKIPKDIDCLGYCAQQSLFSYVHKKDGKISVGFAYFEDGQKMIQE